MRARSCARASAPTSCSVRWCADAWSQVNGADVDTTKFTDTRARRLAEREFNLSWTDALPKGNAISRGEFWTPDTPAADAGMSLEDGIAETLGVKLGDTLTFDVAGNGDRQGDEPAQGRLGQLPRQLLRAVPARTARPRCPRRTSPRSARRTAATRGWPRSCRRTRTSSRSTSARSCGRCRASWTACRARSSSCSCSRSRAGLLVLQAAIAATQDERKFDAAILRTLGASQRQLAAAQIAEFLLLGALAGLVAAAGATATGWALADRVFKIPFEANPMVWVYGLVRRRARGDACRVARHARDDAPAAARGDPATGLEAMDETRDAQATPYELVGGDRARARAGRRVLRPHGSRGGVRGHSQAASRVARRLARQALLVPVRLAGRPVAVYRALRASAPARAPPADSPLRRASATSGSRACRMAMSDVQLSQSVARTR